MTTQGRVIIGVFLLFAPIIRGQQTTTTNSNCNLYGNNANCTSTSTTTDNAAQQQQAYEAGQRVGSAIGQGIAAGMQAHAFSKGLQRYCDAHPGEEWHYYSRTDGHALSSGHCPSDDDKALAAANTFMAHHKDFIKGQENSQALIAYLDTHDLDPRLEKSYERAYKDLKKSGKLQLYSK